MAIEVIALRAWRDNYLSKYWLGNQFIRIYYKIAPILARHIADKEYLKIFLKKVLDIFIKCLTKSNGSE
ncbi:MAG: hypothetical protein M0Z70_06035 [Nitrospiraceae bacterium]|nr:hypothetical protein [Nitrospirota bacterium]MDA8338841.1 hypothetical protein [Nitrospiraceae bacterium]